MNPLRFRVSTTSRVAVCLFAASAAATGVRADLIPIPNFSFESPSTSFVTVAVDSWQKAPQPDYFKPDSFGFQWVQTAGAFINTPPSSTSDHIDNVDGVQAAYLLAFPQVAFSQDLTGAAYQPGVSYNLAVGVLASGLATGDILTLSLYYRDAGNQAVTVASQAITYTAEGLPTKTHLTDFFVNVPTVQASDAWAGKSIGVAITSTYGTGAGSWDVDNVRLTSVPEPGSTALAAVGAVALAAAGWRRRQS